jgi:hypothetical protein
MRMTDFRIKITTSAGSPTYIARRDGRVSYVSASLMALGLDTLAGEMAAELMWALEDATGGGRQSRRSR